MDYEPRSFAPINISRHFALPADAVFDAWTTPSLMAQWIFTSRMSDVCKVEVDLRVGGVFSISERLGREFIRHAGVFQKIARPHNLSFTLEVPQRFTGTSTCVVGIASTPDGCVMTFQQSGVAREAAEANWRAMFRKMGEALVERRSRRRLRDFADQSRLSYVRG